MCASTHLLLMEKITHAKISETKIIISVQSRPAQEEEEEKEEFL